MNESDDGAIQESRVDVALDEYFEQLDRGRDPLHVIRARLLDKFSDEAAALNEYFAIEDRISPQAETEPKQVDVPALETIRYIGNYQLLEEIGRGGMGILYKARQTTVDRIVAVKMILKGQLANEIDIERFRHEARMAAQLNHPNIVAVHEVGEHEGHHYFSMDYVEGDNFAKLLHDRPPTPRQAAEHAKSIAEAIDYAHHQGVLHRDLKPANIMFDTTNEQIRITDFGLGKRIGEDLGLTETGQALGTLRYMAPEQAEGNRALTGVASDVYSIGAILYELLTGCPVVWSGFLGGMLQQIQSQEPISPRRHDKNIPVDLATICLKCLEKEPHKRYPSAEHLALDLGRFLAGKPVEARPVRAPARVWRWSKRNPGWATAIVAAMLLAATTTFYFAQAASVAEMEQRRQALVFEAEHITETNQRFTGWRDNVRQKLIAASKLRSDQDVVGAFSKTLYGADAELLYRWSFESGRVSFSNDDRLVIYSIPGGGAREFDVATGVERNSLKGESNSGAMGPIGFDDENRPTQITFRSPSRFAVTKLQDSPDSIEFELPSRNQPEGGEEPQAQKNVSEVRDHLDKMAQATPNMSHLVTWHGLPDEMSDEVGSPDTVALWDLRKAKLLRSVHSRASALAITSDGRYFAIGRADGQVEIRTHDSDISVLTIPTGMFKINAIAFGRNPRVPNLEPNHFPALGHAGWLLAVGDNAGRIAIWDLSTELQINSFSDIVHHVNNIKFSEDSSILVSAGHRNVRLWNTFGHGSFLTLIGSMYRHDVALSKDGTLLAHPGIDFVKGGPFQESCVWKIEPGRGIKTLRGLSTPGAKVVFSPDNRMIAGLANDWTIGIWDVQTSRVRCLLQAQPGIFVDNCDMRFSNDGKSFFFSAGSKMTRFDIASAAETENWNLPKRGLQDRIGITKDDRVLLMRYDREKLTLPLNEIDFGICRLREMHAGGSEDLLGEWDLFDVEIRSITGTSDGRYFVLDGTTTQIGRKILVVNGKTRKAFPISLKPNVNNEPSIADEAEVAMFQHIDEGGSARLFGLQNQNQIRKLPMFCSSISADGRLGLSPGGSNDTWCDLYEIKSEMRRLVRFQLSVNTSDYDAAFSLDSKYVAWANQDGTVFVCDIERIRQELRLVDAGW